MLRIVTWLWKKQGYRSQFAAEHVNILRNMVARHYLHPHEVVCVTDLPNGIDPRVRVVPAWNDYASVPSPHGAHQPSCYRRLRAFHPDIAEHFGERFVSIDLDTVIVGDMTPIWDRTEDFVAWGETNPKSYYNGSMMLLTAGTRPHVWQLFDPRQSPQLAFRAGKFGSDQGWISYCLGKGEPIWTTADGVYSYNVHLRPPRHSTQPVKPLPENARIVMFHGSVDPWSPEAQALPFVKEQYR